MGRRRTGTAQETSQPEVGTASPTRWHRVAAPAFAALLTEGIGILLMRKSAASVEELATASLLLAATSTGSLLFYRFAGPRLGRVTALAALSIVWAVLLIVLGLFTPRYHSTTDLGAYGLTGMIAPWLIALLTVFPAGALLRVRKIAAWSASKMGRPDTSRPSAKRTAGAQRHLTGRQDSAAKKPHHRHPSPRAIAD